MLCQNCNKNEANMHMKRIINGSAAEVHLCSDCARSLGYGEAFSGFGLGFGELLGELLSKGESSSAGCHSCGKTFEEIARDGKMGCADCYGAFYDKLMPYINRIHGRASYIGTKPEHGDNNDMYIEKLKSDLKNAIDEQNFEFAAKLRDEIAELSAKGGNE